MYLYREYFRPKAYSIWVHGPFGIYVEPKGKR